MSHVRLEALQPLDDVFVLDRSTLDGSESMVLTSRYGTKWQGIECDSTGITVNRGGSRQGLGTKIDVGSLNASFVDGVNPVDDPDLRPGVPVRLLAEVEIPADITTFIAPANPFTYSTTAIWDVADTDIPKRITLEVRVSRATDVRWASNGYPLEDYQRIPANTWTTVTGLVAGGWNRPNLYFNRGDFPYEGDGDQPVTLEMRNVSAVELGSPLFTGSIDRFRVNYDKQDDRSYISMTALDGVARIASTPRNGADGPEPWPERFSRLLKSCPVPYVAPVTEEEDPDSVWIEHENPRWGRDQIDDWSGTWGTHPDSYWFILNQDTTGLPVSRTFNVTPGRLHNIEVVLTIVSGDADDITVTVDGSQAIYRDLNATGSTPKWAFDFVAQTPTFTVTVEAAPGVEYGIRHTLWQEHINHALMAPVVHESDLASHLDITANSADVGWYLDREGTVRIAEGDGDPVVHFSDIHDDEDPLHVCYTEADVSYDTAEATNTIRFSNHGRRPTGEPIEYPVNAPPSGFTAAEGVMWDLWDGATDDPITGSQWIEFTVSVDVPLEMWWPIYTPGTGTGSDFVYLWPGRPYQVSMSVPYTGTLHFAWPVTYGAGTASINITDVSVQTVAGDEADDTTHGPFIEHAAAATWGERAEELETALVLASAATVYGDSHTNPPAELAARLLDRYATPSLAVSAVTFNAIDYPDIAPQLDIHTKVSVTHRGLARTSTIVGIDHDIRPDDWFITITLQEARN